MEYVLEETCHFKISYIKYGIKLCMIFNKTPQTQKCIYYSVKQNTNILSQIVIIIMHKESKIN